MKRILFIALLLSTITSFAQPVIPTTAPFTSGYQIMSQMWNTANVYRNVPYWTDAKHTNLGSQVDTVGGTTTITTYYANLFQGYRQSVVNADTFIPAALPDGSGTIVFTVSAKKAQVVAVSSLNPTVVFTPQSSSDGIKFADIPGVTSVTITPTTTTAVVKKFYLTSRQDNFFGMKCSNTGDTAGIFTSIDFQRTLNTVINK